MFEHNKFELMRQASSKRLGTIWVEKRDYMLGHYYLCMYVCMYVCVCWPPVRSMVLRVVMILGMIWILGCNSFCFVPRCRCNCAFQFFSAFN